jgi:hypothetical protein
MIYEDIKQQFNRVIQFSQGFPKVNSDALFDQWLEAKRNIIEAFDGKLIYEVSEPVHFHLDEKNRTRAFEEFVSHIKHVYHNDSLADFLTANEKSFFDNIVCNPYEYQDIKVPVGMKIVKAFKFFEKDKELLELFQNLASQVIQEDRVEGTLCFSVHPLDFLTTSVNTYNWRSCHALDGEFRAGNLSYMLDSTTIVCYIKGANEAQLPFFPSDVVWNSKKWRVLLYLSENWNMIFASKQYPFTTMGGLDIVLPYFCQALKLRGFSEWKSQYVLHVPDKNGGRTEHMFMPYIALRGELYKIDQIIQDGEHALQFNDLLCSSTYKEPYFAVRDDFYWWSASDALPKFTIGRAVPCLCCGEKHIQDSSMMACRDCVERFDLYYNEEDCPICDCCGAHIFDNDWMEVEGQILCLNCIENETFVCEACDNYFFNERKVYDRKTDSYICEHCYHLREEE